MTFRSDLEYRDGKLAVRQDTSADAKKPLPQVTLSDRLMSTAWEKGFQKELKKYGYDEDHSLMSVLAAQRGMAETAQRLVKMRENQHPSDTQYQHLNKVAREYEQAIKTHGLMRDRARSTITHRLNEVDDGFKKSVNYDTRDAQEIRAVLREMKPSERAEAIGAAIGSGDGNVLAAVLDANPIATGITKEQQEAYRTRAMHQHRPDLLALERELKRADELVFSSFNDLLEMDKAVTAKDVREHYQNLARQAEENATQPQY